MTDGKNTRVPFPNLTAARWRVTSQCDSRYNCVAFAVGDTQHWWWPGERRSDRPVFWPLHAREETVPNVRRALAVRGFTRCDSGDLEPGWEKVAVYALADDDPTHVARQLESGAWTSKLGDFEDIEHDTPTALEGPAYGTVYGYMKRRRDGGQEEA